jgi:hypothetical protein
VWIAAGGAVTHGLPLKWSVGLGGDALLRIERFDFALGGFWAPQRSVPVVAGQTSGEILLRFAAARARGCYAVTASERLRAAACAEIAVASLTGQGQDAPGGVSGSTSSSSAWVLVGAGADAEVALSSRIGLGFSAGILAPTQSQTVSVKDNRASQTPALARYESDPLTAWGAVDLRLRIW